MLWVTSSYMRTIQVFTLVVRSSRLEDKTKLLVLYQVCRANEKNQVNLIAYIMYR